MKLERGRGKKRIEERGLVVRGEEQPEPHRSVRPDRTAKTAEDRPLQGKAGRAWVGRGSRGSG